ncbi:uncharacterized protein LOC119669336 [Teleopsis dalmanni]|uniref:uncharacterized protein LOC119669336 n=1 Tax=Teleopsis dalmanni TaxID=139649 RepID=UPI0018CC905D|nr:uncharacterized protein LOC119669336 [Teleopsis dalmanni]
MPKLLNGLYSGNRAISPELMESQPALGSGSIKSKGKFWIFSMIIERVSSPRRADSEDADTPLESILQADPAVEQVCLLRDSPFRILRTMLYSPLVLQNLSPKLIEQKLEQSLQNYINLNYIIQTTTSANIEMLQKVESNLLEIK